MKLIKIHIKNFRSIVDSGEIRIAPLQAFVGENNTGKSNLLRAINVFLSSGVDGVEDADFFNTTEPIEIIATFADLGPEERHKLRMYLIDEKLILKKQIRLQADKKSGKLRPTAEYHGYVAIPKDWWLSTEKVIEHENSDRPNWLKVAQEHDIKDYVQDLSGKVTKSSYEEGLKRLLFEKEKTVKKP